MEFYIKPQCFFFSDCHLYDKRGGGFSGVSSKTIYRLKKKGLLLPMKDARGRKYFAEKELEKLYQKTRIATPA
jgi:predicted site-specific integrase-resolvase